MFAGRIAYLLLAALVLLWHTAAAQTTELDQFRALLIDGQHIEGSSATITDDRLTGTLKDGSPAAIPLQAIKRLDRSKGTQEGKGALIGAGLGLGLGFLGWAQALSEQASNPGKAVDNSTIVPVMLLFTGAGAVVGMIIGSGSQAWENVPLDGSFLFLPDKREVRFQLCLDL